MEFPRGLEGQFRQSDISKLSFVPAVEPLAAGIVQLTGRAGSFPGHRVTTAGAGLVFKSRVVPVALTAEFLVKRCL